MVAFVSLRGFLFWTLIWSRVFSLRTLPRLQCARRPTDGATTVENPKDKICHVLQVTNVTSLGEVTQRKEKKFGALLCYSGSFNDSTNICQTQVQQLMNLLSWTANDRSTNCDPSPPFISSGRAPDRRCVLKQGQQEERYYLHHHHCHIMLFLEKKDNKHRQRYNHALTDPRKRGGGWLAREESALRMFDTLGLSREQTFLIWHQGLSVYPYPPRIMLQQCREGW